MIQEDDYREGFLTKEIIKHVLKKLGMPVNSTQMELLTSVLGTKGKGSYCYLEMIALLFGEDTMKKYMNEYQIKYGV